MRLPGSWDDPHLLQDEPFTPLFFAYSGRSTVNHSWRRLIATIKEKHAPQITRALSAWLELAFTMSSDQDEVSYDPVAPSFDEGLEIFVKVYWLLFLQQEEDALQLLEKERKERGFGRLPSLRWSQRGKTNVILPRKAESTRWGRKTSRIVTNGTRRGRKPKPIRAPPADEQYDAEASEDDHQESHEGAQVALPAFAIDGEATASSGMQPTLSSGTVGHGTSRTRRAPEDAGCPVITSAGSHPSGRKRKATNEPPYSTSHSSSNEGNLPNNVPHLELSLDPPDDGFSSPLTALTSDDSDTPHIIDVTASELPVPASSSRRNPSRQAARPEVLKKMMHRETLHQMRKGKGVFDAPRDSSWDVPPIPRTQLATRGRGRNGRGGKANRTGDVHLAGALSSVMMPTTRARRSIFAQKASERPATSTSTRNAARTAYAPSPASEDAAVPLKTHKKATRKSERNLATAKKPQQYTVSVSSELPAKKRRRLGKDGEYSTLDDDDLKAQVARKGRKSTFRVGRHREDALQAHPLQLDVEPIVHGPAKTCTRKTRSRSRAAGSRTAQMQVRPGVGTTEKNATTTGVMLDVEAGDTRGPPCETVIANKSQVPACAGGKRKRPSNPAPSATMPTPSCREKVPRPAKGLPRRPPIKAVRAPAPMTAFVKTANRNEVDATIRNAATEAIEVQAEVSTRLEPTSDWEGEGSEAEDPLITNHDEQEPKPHNEKALPANDAPPSSPPFRPYRPPLRGYPPMWAESRQEVCESFDWFRSYQGGVYFMKDLVKGYLLGGFSSSRDVFEHGGCLIISHGGGKAESVHTKAGHSQTLEADDQLAEDKSVRALLNTYKLQQPLVLLADDRYALFPFDLASRGFSYVVLGFYFIAHAWAERQPASNHRGYVVRYKFAFQWCSEQGEPWWSSPLHVARAEPGQQCLVEAIRIAGMNSASVYQTAEHAIDHSPSLLEPSLRGSLAARSPDALSVLGSSRPPVENCNLCHTGSPVVYAQGWMCLQPTCPSFWELRSRAKPATLTYAKTFLQLVPHQREGLPDLGPGVPVPKNWSGITTTRLFCKGWHCQRCGRLSSRFKWEHWECANCGETYVVRGRLRQPKEFWGQARPGTYLHHHVAPDSGIIVSNTESYAFAGGRSFYHQYILPHGRGRIFLIIGNPLANREADGIFNEYQEQAQAGRLLFRRWPMRAHKCRGTLLTNYFSQNSGEPYQYVGGAANTVSWAEAPSAVRKALDLIKRRTENALGLPTNFNEVLSAGYMEKQKMAFHSDAERGLGPTVASLSLGSAAYMYFRLHGQYDDKAGKGANRNALTLYLRHGDVLVMEGEGIQKYYEHTVVPMNFRIAATARYIGEDNAQIKL